MWRHALQYTGTNVSEELAASIFTIFHPLSSVLIPWRWKQQVPPKHWYLRIYHTTWYHIPEDVNLSFSQICLKENTISILVTLLFMIVNIKYFKYKEVEWVSRIWGSCSGDYEEFYILRYNIAWFVKVSQHFLGTCHLHLQGWRVSQARNQHEASSKLLLSFQPWRWRQHVPPKLQLTLNELHRITSQNKWTYRSGWQ
jgi:hypothetical protein